VRVALVAIAAALIVIFASAAALFVLTGDTIGAGFFLALALISAVLLWIVSDHVEEI
jgi:hypothetical protein